MYVSGCMQKNLIQDIVSILTSRASSLLHKPGQGPSEATITRRAHSRRCFSCPRITNTRWLLASHCGKLQDSTRLLGEWFFCKGDSVDRNNFRIFIYLYDVATFWRCEKWHKNSPTFTFERTSAKKNVHRVSLFPSLDLVPPQKGQKWRYDGFGDWAQIDSCKYVGSISKVPKMPHCKSSLVKVVKEISRSLICALKHPSHVRQNPRKSDEMRI